MTYTRRHSNKLRNRNSSGGNFHNHSRQRITGRGVTKPLNPNLFIKKAANVPTQEVEPETTPPMKFSDFNITEKLKRNIEEHGYVTPTPIQEKAIPEILNGRDIIGMAHTGTGKTAAFLISLINKCYLDRSMRVLIIVPTRELAIQIRDEFKLFAKGTDLEAATVIGGVSVKRQVYALSHKPHFVIGTPGRIKDLIQNRSLNLNLFQNIVLDEVDRMVDIGFLKDIQFIISFLPKTRQSLFFSATVDAKTQQILQMFVVNPVTISAQKKDSIGNIEQDVVRLSNNQEKIEVLHDLLIKPGFDKVIVFGRTKWGMEKLSRALLERGFKSAAIHGNKTQNQRQRALDDFKQGRVSVLIATDIASRGIDIDDVSHVINYDPPITYDDYIHRIGRTGRAGKRGVALTFVD